MTCGASSCPRTRRSASGDARHACADARSCNPSHLDLCPSLTCQCRPIGLAGLLEELLAMGFSNLASFSAALDTARDSPVLQARGAGKRGRKRKGRRGRGDAGEEQEGLPRVPGAEVGAMALADASHSFWSRVVTQPHQYGAQLLATCKAFVECLTLVLGGLGEGKKGGQVGENNARHYCAALQASGLGRRVRVQVHPTAAHVAYAVTMFAVRYREERVAVLPVVSMARSGLPPHL